MKEEDVPCLCVMAVDLTPRFRRLNSQSRILQPGYSGPFRATQLWQNIILALRSQVEVRRRRKHLRVHPSCFTGSDAVDAVLSHLMQSVVFGASEVSRLKAARLCQALMEARVFEAVGTKLFRRDKEAAFEDSGCSLYRFLDGGVLPDGFEKADGCGSTESSGRKDEKRKKSCRLAEMRTISNPLAVGSSDRRVERLFKTINLQPILPASMNRAPSAPLLSKSVVEEVWKQQTLLQLLQVVDLPMLDCILTSPGCVRPHARGSVSSHQAMVISNTCLDRQLPDNLSLPQLDVWLAAAADCLELFPDQLIVAAGEQLRQQAGEGGAERGPAEREGPQKKLLFDTIAKYYSGQDRAPLLSDRYMEVHAAILSLLDCGKMAEGTRACQLCFRLLEPGSRDELRRLLAFMATASQPDAYRLHKQTDNRALISRMFQKGIIQNKDLSRSQSETLVLFLMDNHTQLFKTPTSLIKAVKTTLQTLQQGRDPDFIATFSFCQQVSPQQYEDQRDAATLDSLKQLLQQVSLDARLSTKDRGRLLRDFQRHHPVVFLQHFSSTF